MLFLFSGTKVEECGLFVYEEDGRLAATPDRIATNAQGEKIVIEAKCLSASRHLTPRTAVLTKQRNGGFAFKMEGSKISIKEKHTYYTQVLMQMAVTGIKKCHLVIFTNSKSPVEVVEVDFDPKKWKCIEEKLLNFHQKYIVPALVNELCRKK